MLLPNTRLLEGGSDSAIEALVLIDITVVAAIAIAIVVIMIAEHCGRPLSQNLFSPREVFC